MDLGQLAHIFYPGNIDNILSFCDLPGWKEGLVNRLAVVFDPHNIAQVKRISPREMILTIIYISSKMTIRFFMKTGDIQIFINGKAQTPLHRVH